MAKYSNSTLAKYIKLTKNRSDTTIREYYYDLREIFQFIKFNKVKNNAENT